MAGKKKKKEDQALGAPLWMITYGDMMSLLLCFFILLFSFSTLDVVKFRDVIIELQGAFGVLSGGPMVLNLGDIPARQITENPSANNQRMEQIEAKIEKKVQEENLENSIETTISERGLLIRFTDAILFDLGSAILKPEAFPVLDVINEELRTINNSVQVEGHTDPTPISTPQFPSNWELSTARATAIIHYAIENGGIMPERLSAAGFAFYHPVAPNTSAENRARNRRVDIIILNTEETVEVDRREDVLSYLESSATDGIVMTLPDETSGSNDVTEDTDQPETEDRQTDL